MALENTYHTKECFLKMDIEIRKNWQMGLPSGMKQHKTFRKQHEVDIGNSCISDNGI